MEVLSDTISKPFSMQYDSVTELPSVWFDKWVRGGGACVREQGLRKMGCDFKINSEYSLGATFVFDTLSCVPSQFTGTAWVRHSLFVTTEQECRHPSQSLFVFWWDKQNDPDNYHFLPRDSSLRGGGRGSIPNTINNNNAWCKEFRPFTVSHWKRCRAPNTGPTSTRGFGVCVCAEGVSSEVPWLLQCLNKPSALRALGVRSSLLPIKDGPCH